MEGRFVIVDASSLLYRAFYAVPPLLTSTGLNTGALYGLANMLLRLIGDTRPRFAAAAFDKSRVTFRNSLYGEYKAQRKPTPGELIEQMPIARRLARAFGFTAIEFSGYEADDIIGALCDKAGGAGIDSLIVTGDRDALQLISEKTKVLLTKKGISETKLLDLAALQEEYGLTPAQVTDLKGLMGDVSDNIPGVPGVGEKTALKLLEQYGSLECVIANIPQIKGKLGEKLAEHRDLALLSKRLATIERAVPLDFSPERFIFNPDRQDLEALARELEMRSLTPKIADLFPALQAAPAAPAAREIDRAEEAREFLYGDKPLFIQPVIEGKLPCLKLTALTVRAGEKSARFERDSAAWPLVREWLASERPKTGCDVKRLYTACQNDGGALNGLTDDLAVAAYLIDPSLDGYTEDALCGRFSPGAPQSLPAALLGQLEAAGQGALYREVEMPLIKVLAGMERAGITVDEAALAAMSLELADKLNDLKEKIFSLSGEEFNINSPRQLGTVLFEKLALPVRKKTKTGYSTDAEVLETLTGYHPVVEEVLNYRFFSKLKSTYLEGLKPLIDPATGRVHTNFQQLVTVTGRLSSTEPNLQNIPARTTIGRRIRGFFVPGEGFDQIVSFDYSQIELRILAHISGDRLFTQAFLSGQDIHRRTAAEVFGVPPQQVTPQLRGRAKAVNFGIVYGISDYGLARDLGISREEANLYIKNYFARYTGVRDYMDEAVAKARRSGYATTLFNRRRGLPDINSANFNRRSFAERTAINTPIQGAAADIIKKAMVDVAALAAKHKLKSRLLLQVHDELVFEAPDEEIPLLTKLVREKMQTAAKLAVPLIVDVAAGKNWADAKG